MENQGKAQESDNKIRRFESQMREFEHDLAESRKTHSPLLAPQHDKADESSRVWIENSPVCTKILDTDLNLLYMSHAGIQGLKIDEVDVYYGKPYPFDFFPAWSKDSVVNNLEQVKATGRPITVEMPALDLEGNALWFLATMSPIFQEDGTLDYIMVVSTDITQRKAAEKQVREINAELVRSNKALLEAKEKAEQSEKLQSAFLANMSHEIRTPLNSILGFTSLLKNDTTLSGEEKNQFLEYIESSSNRLMRIISDILDLSKIDAKQLSIDPEIVDINELMDGLLHQFLIRVDPAKVSLSCSKGLECAASRIMVDPIRLSQILSNLIDNACKFTGAGSIQFGYQSKGDVLEFFVKDTGVGIDPAQHEVVFERFRQIDNRGAQAESGTGLGLPIVKELCHLMGGEIWIHSAKGMGATVYFTIPYAVEHWGERNPAQSTVLPKANAKVTVLVAEDEQMNYLYLEALLKKNGFTVLRAETGQQAIDMLDQNADIDLVFMDIRMPDLDGLEAARIIRQLGKTVPIVGQSAYAMPEDKRKGLEAGFNDYLEKPISQNQLNDIIHKHIG